MAKPYGKPVLDCPACKKPIGDAHPYEWCCECGEPLALDVQQQIPSLALRIAKRAARTP